MTNMGPHDAYDRAHVGHAHDTFAITVEDMKDPDRLRRLLMRASYRTQSSSEQLDKMAADLGEAMGSNDPVRIRNRQAEYDVAKCVFDGWVTHQDRLLRRLAHLDAENSAQALKRATWALVIITGALLVATLVAAFIAQS